VAKPIPDGFNTLSAHIVVKDPAKAIDFYKKAFGAEEIFRMPSPDGGVMHAELRIGNSVLMIGPEWGDQGRSPESIGGSPVTLHLYVNDCDKSFDQAVKAGCVTTMPLWDSFWGDRYSKVKDPFGHQWSIATHKEDLSPEQIGQRAQEWFAKNPS
jgi:uncharacterized glyoxalase superfamily protein PhnB